MNHLCDEMSACFPYNIFLSEKTSKPQMNGILSVPSNEKKLCWALSLTCKTMKEQQTFTFHKL